MISGAVAAADIRPFIFLYQMQFGYTEENNQLHVLLLRTSSTYAAANSMRPSMPCLLDLTPRPLASYVFHSCSSKLEDNSLHSVHSITQMTKSMKYPRKIEPKLRPSSGSGTLVPVESDSFLGST